MASEWYPEKGWSRRAIKKWVSAGKISTASTGFSYEQGLSHPSTPDSDEEKERGIIPARSGHNYRHTEGQCALEPDEDKRIPARCISDEFFTPFAAPCARRYITIGIELEMILLGLKFNDNPFDLMCKILQSLYNRGIIPAQAQRFDHDLHQVADLNKFLVMSDESIDSRYKKITTDELFCEEKWCDTLARHLNENGIIGLEYLHFLKEFAALDPLEFWPKELTSSSTNEESNTSDSGDFWGANKWDQRSFSSVTDISTPAVSEISQKQSFNEDDIWVHGSPVEICTPVMSRGSWKWLIPIVLDHLTSSLRLHFNTTTGLHVHIGCGVGQRWSLCELKSIAKAVVIFESVLDHVHAPHRMENQWAIRSTRNASSLADFSTLDAVRKIEAAYTKEDFLALVGAEKFYKYNFSANYTLGTIEFRQAEAHADGQRVVQWIEMVIHFVEAAIDTNAGEFDAWAAVINGPVDTLKLGELVWSRFGLPWRVISPIVSNWQQGHDEEESGTDAALNDKTRSREMEGEVQKLVACGKKDKKQKKSKSKPKPKVPMKYRLRPGGKQMWLTRCLRWSAVRV